jgi:hypothetical protein
MRVQADGPLQLTAPNTAAELQLHLGADYQQWCLRATDAHGSTPAGPLFMTLQASSTWDWAFVDPGPDRTGGAQAVWAGFWGDPSDWGGNSVALTAWAGGRMASIT